MPLKPLHSDLDQLRAFLEMRLTRSPHDYLRDSPQASVQDRQAYIDHLARPIEDEIDLRMGRRLTEEHTCVAILGEILPWDTRFFGYTVARIDQIVLSQPPQIDTAKSCLREYAGWAQGRGVRYLFARVDAAEVGAIQALCLAGYTLIETRHTYYCPLADYVQERHPVRPAVAEDVPALQETARIMMNPYDRFHADPFIDPRAADALMEQWVKASIIEGFADLVLVPDVPQPQALATVRTFQKQWAGWGRRMGQLTFGAVQPSFKGWYCKLISEANYWLRDSAGADLCLFTTQAANHAAIRSVEKLGFRFGKAEHIFRIVL